MRPLVYTTLWPDPARPHHGSFVATRMLGFARRFDVPLAVVAPRPIVPPCGPARWRAFAGAPASSELQGHAVAHPRYLSLPGFGDRWRAGLLARGSRAALLERGRALQATLLDAHYAWPDGVAAARLRPALAAALGRRVPLVITARGTDLNLAPSIPVVRAQLAAALGQADHVVCVAEALREVVLSLGVPSERVSTLRNGVDVERFAPGERGAARAALGLPRDGEWWLCVGHLVERKGQHLLLEALARPEARAAGVRLALVGRGEAQDALAAQARRLGLQARVRFVGAVRPDALPDWYRAADLLVLPSLREGWPNVVLEALACGTPVVATEVWGTPEILRGCAAGALCAPDVASLAAALAARDRLSAGAARPWALARTWEPVLDALHAIFERVGGA